MTVGSTSGSLFILEEDAALKAKLTGITVSDDRRTARPVEVWFGQPDLELQKRTYPYISVELIDINESAERTFSGQPVLKYIPTGWSNPGTSARLMANNFPTPYDLDYQVTAWSRHPRHDRQMLSQLLGSKLPIRFGQLHLATTNRYVRLDMLGGPRVADTTDDNGKRLFRKVFTARVATELFLDDALSVAGLVSSVRITGKVNGSPDFTKVLT